MKNEEIKAEFIRVLASDDLHLTHPTIKAHGAEFVDYTKDGVLTMKYPIRQDQCNGYRLLQGGNIYSFIDDNFGLFTFIALEGKAASTIDASVTFHKAATLQDGYVTVESRVVAAGKRIISMSAKVMNPSGTVIASCSTNFINGTGAWLEY